ncbi:MAG: hypothetical protein ACJ71Z_10000 [Aeromicrobium sp.]
MTATAIGDGEVLTRVLIPSQREFDRLTSASVALIGALDRLAFAMHEEEPELASAIAALVHRFEGALVEPVLTM